MNKIEADRAPNPIDIHVGLQVRLRRKELKISQEKLAETIGLTFQQVQKYERGTNRISASKLYEIARTLRVSIAWFFEGLSDPKDGRIHGEIPPGAAPFTQAFLMTSEGIDLANFFPRIEHPRVRRKLVELVRSLADSQDEEETEPAEA